MLGQNYTVQTVAGGALPADGAASLAISVGQPWGVAIDPDGNIFLSVQVQSIVVRIDAKTGLMSRIAGTGGTGYNGDNMPATSAELNQPAGIALDSAGNLYIADSVNNRIRMVSNGQITTVAGTGANGYNGDGVSATTAQLSNPQGIAFDATGNLYIADSGNNRIRMVSGGTISTVAGTGFYGYNGDGIAATAAWLYFPQGVALDSAGNLYIADSDNNLVRMVSNGQISTVAGTGYFGYSGDSIPATSAQLANPTALALDSAGNLYITDYSNNRLRKVSGGVITTVAGTGTANYNGDSIFATSAQLYNPSSVAVDSANNVYIADYGNNRIRKLSSTNPLITTVVGSGSAGYNGDNIAATSAQLAYPGGIAVGPAGSVYIADARNNRVRMVSNGVITTVAGTGTFGYNGDNISATSAQLVGPQTVALDAAGNLYIADEFNQRVRKVSNGVITTIAGTGIPGYNGDGIPAVSAQLNNPYGVAVDAAGNVYIADTNNNRVRVVSASSGLITTVAGIGFYGYNGDDIPPATAMLAYPAGLAIDAAGSIYIADWGNSRIRKISNRLISTVAGTGNAGFNGDNTSARLADLNYPIGVAVDSADNLYIADEGNSRIRKVTAATGLITTLAGTGFPGYNGDNITGAVAQLSYAEGVAVDTAGNVYFADTVNNRVRVLVPPGCVLSLSAEGEAFTAAGGTGAISVTAPAGCSWSISGAPSWVTFTSPTSGTGDSTVTFQIAPNYGATLSGGFTVGGVDFSVQQATALTFAFPFVGSLPQIASGAGWDATFTLVNTGSSQEEALLNLWADSGSPLTLPFFSVETVRTGLFYTNGVLASTLDETLGPNSLLLLDTTQAANAPYPDGSAQLFASGGIDGFVILRSLASGQEAVVPLEKRNASSYVLPFDNTGLLSTGVAVANVAATQANIPVIIRDEAGAVIGPSSGSSVLTLSPYGHASFLLAEQFPVTAGIRGTVEFDTPMTGGLVPTSGQISVLGLRNAPIPNTSSFAFSTLPALANVIPGAGSIAHLATGSGWQTTFTLVNVGATAAQANLSFFDDSGLPLVTTLTIATGNTVAESSLSETLPAGATLTIVADNANPAVVGSAQFTTTGSIGASASFRYNPTGQEATVPLETRNASTYLLAFDNTNLLAVDNTNGISTGVAVANVSSQAADIPVILRDSTGATLATAIITLPPNGHTSFILADPVAGYPVTAGLRGTVEFDTPPGGWISVIGLRNAPTGVGNAFAVTTIPPLMK